MLKVFLKWDADMHPTKTNDAETAEEAAAIAAEWGGGAFYVDDPQVEESADIIVDPVTKTVTVDTAAITTAENNALKDKISRAAEHRLKRGFVLSTGDHFRCDPGSISLINGMHLGSFPKSFDTASYVRVTLASLEVAVAVQNEVAGYVAAVLEASSDLKITLPANYDDDSHWPASGI